MFQSTSTDVGNINNRVEEDRLEDDCDRGDGGESDEENEDFPPVHERSWLRTG